jgi:acyl carrier protein
MNEIHDRLQQIAREIFDDDSLVLTDSTVAGDVPNWDSLAHVNFMYSVENEFDIRFSEDEFVGFEDIGGLKQVLLDKVRSHPAP